MIDDLIYTPFKFIMIFFGFICMCLVALAVLFNYTNTSNRNNYEAYILGLEQFAQKNAGFNDDLIGKFNEFDEALTNRHIADLPAEVVIMVELRQANGAPKRLYSKKVIGKNNVTGWSACDTSGNAASSGAINVRLQKGETFTITVNPYYRELNTFSDEMHSAENQVEVNGTTYDYSYKGRTLSITGVSHGYLKEDNVTQDEEAYIKSVNGGFYSK